MYKAIAFSLDGEYITEGEYKTIDEVRDLINNWGSRWIFYPITGVVKNKRVVSMCDNFTQLQNKNINTIQKIIKKNQESFSQLF